MKLRFGLFGILTILLVGGMVFSQDTKSSGRARSLPPNWGKLGLSDEQKDKIYTVQGEYRTKIDDLQKQIRKLQAEQRTELMKVLTDAQKARLREIISAKAGDTGGKDAKEKNKQ